jgi:hypothetical protein
MSKKRSKADDVHWKNGFSFVTGGTGHPHQRILSTIARVGPGGCVSHQ